MNNNLKLIYYRMKIQMNHIVDYLISPFRKYFALFIVVFFLVSFNLFTSIDEWKFWLCLLAHGVMDSYFVVLLYSCLPAKIKKIYMPFVMCIISAIALVDLFSIVVFQRRFDIDVAYIIMGTNIIETLEFLSEFVTFNMIILILVLFVIFYVSYYFIKEKVKLSLRKSYIFLMLVLASIFLNLKVINPFYSSFIGKLYTLTLVSNVPDLKQYYTHPQLEKIAKQPQNIIIIFGESFSKQHSSLYGYEKVTNPYLSTLQNDSLLFVFNNITSPALHTIESFKSMMSTYKQSYADSCKWYECMTIPEIAKELSYTTYWISNQSQKGLHENVVASYAQLCDSVNFIGDKYAGCLKRDFDEEVINPTIACSKDSQRLFFIHLMGSHYKFEERYPIKFNKFKDSDYIDCLPSQRHNLASYDNSILYNDSVVYQLINIFKNKEAIIFYFPDHSLDIYNSSDDYCAHAKPNDSVSVKAGKEIPFMIYFSELYQQEYPNEVNMFKKNLDKSFCTENILFTIMDVMGAKFRDNENVLLYSLMRR